MKTVFAILGTVALAALVLAPLTAHAFSMDEKMIAGEWRYDSGGDYPVYDIYIFESDGTGTHKHGGDGWEETDDITWKITDGKLSITDQYGTATYDYDLNGDYSELTLTNVDHPDSSLTYKRQGSVFGSLCCGIIFAPVALLGGAALLIVRRR